MTEKPKKNSSFVLDPVAMGITNKIAKSTKSVGSLDLSEGLLLEGEHRGTLVIRKGPLYIAAGARLIGNVIVKGDVYVLGQFGEEGDKVSKINAFGTLHLAHSAVVHGVISYRGIAMYEGAQMRGRIEPLPQPAQKAPAPPAVPLGMGDPSAPAVAKVEGVADQVSPATTADSLQAALAVPTDRAPEQSSLLMQCAEEATIVQEEPAAPVPPTRTEKRTSGGWFPWRMRRTGAKA